MYTRTRPTACRLICCTPRRTSHGELGLHSGSPGRLWNAPGSFSKDATLSRRTVSLQISVVLRLGVGCTLCRDLCLQTCSTPLVTPSIAVSRHMPLTPMRHMAPEVAKGSFVAPSGMLAGNVSLGKDSSIWYQAMVRGRFQDLMRSSNSRFHQSQLIIHLFTNVSQVQHW